MGVTVVLPVWNQTPQCPIQSCGGSVERKVVSVREVEREGSTGMS